LRTKRSVGGGLGRVGLAVLLATSISGIAITTTGHAAYAAASMRICNGYAACSVAPTSTHGYQSYSSTSFWSSDPGDQCTNYAAFVESKVYGVATPSYLLGNGGDWAVNAQTHGVLVNSTPSIGAVAEWNAGDYGMGRDGHVAIVEKVGTNNSYVEISQQNIVTDTNGYDWEKIKAGGPANAWQPWPDHFIHFAGPGIPPSGSPTASLFAPSSSTLPSTGGPLTLSANVTNATLCVFYSNHPVPWRLDAVPCSDGPVVVNATVPANTGKRLIEYKFKFLVVGIRNLRLSAISVSVPGSGLTIRPGAQRYLWFGGPGTSIGNGSCIVENFGSGNTFTWVGGNTVGTYTDNGSSIQESIHLDSTTIDSFGGQWSTADHAFIGEGLVNGTPVVSGSLTQSTPCPGY